MIDNIKSKSSYELRKILRKSYEEAPLHKVMRYFSVPIAKFLFIYTSISPNFINFIRTYIISLTGMFFFMMGEHEKYILGAIMLFISFLFDKVDGDLARLNMVSGSRERFGRMLDSLSSNISISFFHIGIGIGLFNETGTIQPLINCILILFSSRVVNEILISKRLFIDSKTNSNNKNNKLWFLDIKYRLLSPEVYSLIALGSIFDYLFAIQLIILLLGLCNVIISLFNIYSLSNKLD